MILQANAKINLVLNVSKNVKDGYHEIESLMIPLTLHDSIDVVKQKDSMSTFVTCDSFELSGDQYNIVTKVIDDLRKKFNFKEQYRITIYKRVFISSGLGGGSSDAAAIIHYLNKSLKLGMTLDEMMDFGRTIGSDVPMFILNAPAIVKDSGRDVTPAPKLLKKYHCLVVRAKEGVSTKEAYAKFDEICNPTKTSIDEVIEAYNKNEEELGKLISNDLEPAAIALCPEIQTIKDDFKSAGLKCVMMSGSGSSVFALSENKKSLYKLFKKYYEAGYKAELCKVKI